MSTTPTDQPPGTGNAAALKAWAHLQRAFGQSLHRNVGHADIIALRIIKSRRIRHRR